MIADQEIRNGAYWNRRTQTVGVTYSILLPNTMGNPHPDKYRAEVRHGGWIADYQMFKTADEASAWGEQHTGAMSTAVAELLVQVFGTQKTA